MKNFLVALCLVAAAVPGFAQTRGGRVDTRPVSRPHVTLADAGNGQQVMVKLAGFQNDSTAFKIGVFDVNGSAYWYTSGNGNQTFQIGANGNASMTIGRRYMKPGNVLKIMTYDRFTNPDSQFATPRHTYTRVIPCLEQEWVTIYSDIYDEVVVVAKTCSNGPQPVPAPGPAPAPSCTGDANPVGQNRNQAIAKISCNAEIIGGVKVVVYGQGGAIACERNDIAAGPGRDSEACQFGRDPLHKTQYNIKIFDRAGNLLGDQSGTILKEATFNFPPKAQFVSPLSFAPVKQNKALGRGYYWKGQVDVVLIDEDVDPSEGQRLIQADLVSLDSGKVIATAVANSGEKVSLSFEHDEVQGLFSKKNPPKPSDEGLKKGTNRLKIRLHDAYDKNSIVWPAEEIIVQIND